MVKTKLKMEKIQQTTVKMKLTMVKTKLKMEKIQQTTVKKRLTTVKMKLTTVKMKLITVKAKLTMAKTKRTSPMMLPMMMRRMKRRTSPPARKALRERTMRMLTMREKEKTLMRMKMQKMTSVNGKTGASGLVNAAHSLADALVVILVPGLLTTSCLTLAAADSSV